VAGDRSRVVWPVPGDAPPADLRITTDWETAVAVARGELSTQRALMQGRLRVSGSPDRLGAAARTDPVPAGVRQSTTF
jgi:SCP-2 sterol transfer family protein